MADPIASVSFLDVEREGERDSGMVLEGGNGSGETHAISTPQEIPSKGRTSPDNLSSLQHASSCGTLHRKHSHSFSQGKDDQQKGLDQRKRSQDDLALSRDSSISHDNLSYPPRTIDGKILSRRIKEIKQKQRDDLVKVKYCSFHVCS